MMLPLFDVPLWLWLLTLFALGATIHNQVLTSTGTGANQALAAAYTPNSSTSVKTTVIVGYLTTYSATEAALGVCYLLQGATTKLEVRLQNTDLDSLCGVIVIPFGNGLTFTGSEAFTWQVTPAAATSTRWSGTFFGQG